MSTGDGLRITTGQKTYAELEAENAAMRRWANAWKESARHHRMHYQLEHRWRVEADAKIDALLNLAEMLRKMNERA